mmetsp:Transcript_19815/g.75960  ORF Transcript_19815/g.75960 Transcript_19815/m.75960 type:complete len:150 (-) Transcript_19815:190-639(-)
MVRPSLDHLRSLCPQEVGQTDRSRRLLHGRRLLQLRKEALHLRRGHREPLPSSSSSRPSPSSSHASASAAAVSDSSAPPSSSCMGGRRRSRLVHIRYCLCFCGKLLQLLLFRRFLWCTEGRAALFHAEAALPTRAGQRLWNERRRVVER